MANVGSQMYQPSYNTMQGAGGVQPQQYVQQGANTFTSVPYGTHTANIPQQSTSPYMPANQGGGSGPSGGGGFPPATSASGQNFVNTNFEQAPVPADVDTTPKEQPKETTENTEKTPSQSSGGLNKGWGVKWGLWTSNKNPSEIEAAKADKSTSEPNKKTTSENAGQGQPSAPATTAQDQPAPQQMTTAQGQPAPQQMATPLSSYRQIPTNGQPVSQQNTQQQPMSFPPGGQPDTPSGATPQTAPQNNPPSSSLNDAKQTSRENLTALRGHTQELLDQTHDQLGKLLHDSDNLTQNLEKIDEALAETPPSSTPTTDVSREMSREEVNQRAKQIMMEREAAHQRQAGQSSI